MDWKVFLPVAFLGRICEEQKNVTDFYLDLSFTL